MDEDLQTRFGPRRSHRADRKRKPLGRVQERTSGIRGELPSPSPVPVPGPGACDRCIDGREAHTTARQCERGERPCLLKVGDVYFPVFVRAEGEFVLQSTMTRSSCFSPGLIHLVLHEPRTAHCKTVKSCWPSSSRFSYRYLNKGNS